MTNYESIRSQLNTGDIVLYAGHTPFSDLIKLTTQYQWSHCGMVIKLEEYDFIAVWESTLLSDIRDMDTHSLRRGVQLVPLSDRINQYKGEIAIRQLSGVSFDKNDHLKLMQLRKELSRRRYDANVLELLKSSYDGVYGENKQDLSALFCSELVAEAYQSLGLLNHDIPSNEFTPKDFSAKRQLPLVKGKLGEEILLKVYSTPRSHRPHISGKKPI